MSRCASFKDVTRQLANAEVTAVPVVDAFNRPVGIVSEGDLLSKESAQPEPHDRSDGAWMRPRAQERAAAENADALATCSRPRPAPLHHRRPDEPGRVTG
ncbi:CBS domain-containing protein [Streptacidiphilus sp. PAMC 29251]